MRISVTGEEHDFVETMYYLVIILYISTSVFLPTEAKKEFIVTTQCSNGDLAVNCNQGEVIHVQRAQLGTCSNGAGDNNCCKKQSKRTYNPYLKLSQEINGRPYLTEFQVTKIGSQNIHFVRVLYKCVNITASVNEHVRELSEEGTSELNDSSYLLYASPQRTSRLKISSCTFNVTYQQIGSSVQLLYCRLDNEAQLSFNGSPQLCATSRNSTTHSSQPWVFQAAGVAYIDLYLGSNLDDFIFMNVSGPLSINCTVSRQTASSTAAIGPTPAGATQTGGLSSTIVIVIAVLSSLLLLAAIAVVVVVVLMRRKHAVKKDDAPPRLYPTPLQQSARPASFHAYDYIAAGNEGAVAGDSATYEYESVNPVPGPTSNAQLGNKNKEYQNIDGHYANV